MSIYRYTTNGVHFFDRETGINVLLDEIECPKDRLSIAPASISMALTNKCNRNCNHCFAPKTNDELKLDEVCGWIDELNANGCLGIGFGGGEPMLFPHIKEVCEYVHDNTAMACTLTSNSDYLDEANLQWMEKSVDFVRISTNGVNVDFDKIRNIASRVKVGINYLLNEQTFAALENVGRSCKQIGVKEMLLLPQVGTSKCEGVDKEFVKRLDAWLQTNTLALPSVVSSVFGDGLKSVVNVPGDVGVRQYLHVSADKQVKVSSFYSQGVKISSNGLIHAIKEVYSNENLARI